MQSYSKKFSLNLSNPKISSSPIVFTWSPADSPLIINYGRIVKLVHLTIQQNNELYIAFANESHVSLHSSFPFKGVLPVSKGPFDLLTISSSNPSMFWIPSRKAILDKCLSF